MKHFCYTIIILLISFFLFFGTIVNLCSADVFWSDSDIILIKESAGSWATPYVMVVDSQGTIHIVYRDSHQRNEVYYLNKTRCDNWSEHEHILDGGSNYQMHIDQQNTIHLIWFEMVSIVQGNQTYWTKAYYYCYKPINGDWSDSELFFTGYTSSNAFGESFVVDDYGIVHVVLGCSDIREPFNQGPDVVGYQGLYYVYRLPTGQWSDVELLTTDLQYPSNQPAVTVDSRGIVHLVFLNTINGVYYQQRTNEHGWSSREVIPGSPQAIIDPFITTDIDDTLHVAWGASGVDYLFRTVVGAWSDVMKVTSNESAYPHLAVDSHKNKHFLWIEYVSNESAFDLLYKYKPNNGLWSAAEILCNQGPNYPHELSLELDTEGNIYVIWEETGNLYLRSTWVNTAPAVSFQTENILKRYTDTSYSFYGTVTDDEHCGNIYYYMIDWGDGNNSGWRGPFPNENIFESTHAWSSPGTYNLSVKAKDIQGTESDWSEHVTIVIASEKTPGFEIISVLFAFIMLLIWKHKR